MGSKNIIILEGNMAKDPIAKELDGGVVVTNFTVAVSDGKDKPAMFVSCKIFGTQATQLALNGHRGDVVSLMGRLSIRKWQEKYYTDVIVDHMHITAKKTKPQTLTEVQNEFVAE